jgi:hypothetical protein
MITGRIVEFDAATATYWLPREHAASLTGAAGPDNLAELAQLVSLMGNVETPMIDVFWKGGGLDYSHYGRFHELMAESSRTTLELKSRALEEGGDVAGSVETASACAVQQMPNDWRATAAIDQCRERVARLAKGK